MSEEDSDQRKDRQQQRAPPEITRSNKRKSGGTKSSVPQEK